MPDYYYIFGYNISGWDHPTENVITENVIHSTKPVYPKGWENTDWMGLGEERVDLLFVSCLYIELYVCWNSINNINVDYASFKIQCQLKYFLKHRREMEIVLSIIQTLQYFYYIFGYYISGYDHPNRKCNNRTCNTFHKTCITEVFGQNKWDMSWRREGKSVLSYWDIELDFLATPSSNFDVDYSSFNDNLIEFEENLGQYTNSSKVTDSASLPHNPSYLFCPNPSVIHVLWNVLHFRLLHFRLGGLNRKCNNWKCNNSLTIFE